jgi:ParB family chromosome partitioning protein
MGHIDVDPASCAVANIRVGARRFFSADDNGLVQEWLGNVWMNPPYAQPHIAAFCTKLIAEFNAGRTRQACVLVNNATETQWFQTLLAGAAAVCFINGRVKFLDPAGNPGAPLQGQAALYFGENVDAFGAHFSAFGKVMYS